MISGYWIQLAFVIAVDVALALALLVPYRWGGRLVLCQAPIVAVGAYSFTIAVSALGLPVVPGLLFALVCGILLGLLLPLLFSQLDNSAFALITFLVALGFGEVFENLTTLTGGVEGLPGLRGAFPGLGEVTKLDVVFILGGLSLFLILALSRLHGATFGRNLRAMRDDFVGVQLDGVSPRSIEYFTFGSFAGISALVGALWSLTLPQVIPGYFDVMALGIVVLLGCILFRTEHPTPVALGMIVIVALNEGAQQLPVPPQVRGDLPLLLVGLLYVVLVQTSVQGELSSRAVRLFRRLPISRLRVVR